MKNRFDHIVIGASLPGIIHAVTLASAGRSVLLTNPFGFPGGSITELLNCAQTADRTALHGTTRDVFDAVGTDRFAPTILNPESMKYALQQTIERPAVTPLFHVVPKRIATGPDGSVTVSLLAKEGLLEMSAPAVTDATESFEAAVLWGASRSIVRRSIHLFTTPPRNEQFLQFRNIRSAVRLYDGRYFLTLDIHSRDELFQEHEAHRLLDELRITLEASGARLHVLPLGIHTEYSLEQGTTAGCMTIGHLTGHPVDSTALFRCAADIESI